MKAHPHVVVSTRKAPAGIQGPVYEVYVDGEPFPVTMVGWKSGPDQISEITLSFYGRLEITPVPQT
jgi:hypothetical protein